MGSSSTKPGMKSFNSLRALQRLSHGMSNVGAHQQQSGHSQNGFPRPVNPSQTDLKINSQKSLETVPATAKQTKQMASNGNVQESEQQKVKTGEGDSQISAAATAQETTNVNGGKKAEENQTVIPVDGSVQQEQTLAKPSSHQEAEKKEKIKVYTEEEAEIKKKEYYDRVVQVMEKFVAAPIHALEDEEEKYTTECRNCLLSFAKSYFYFKAGQVPYPVIAQFRLDVSKAFIDYKCVGKLCGLLEDGVRRRHFVKEDGKMNIMFWLPLKNAVLTLLNFSDSSNELKIEIGANKSLFDVLVKFVNDWREPHLNGELSEDRNKFLKWCVSLFHNCGAVEENIPMMRELGVIQAVIPLMDSPIPTLRLSAVATLADIVNEEEAELLQTHTASFKFLLKVLKNSLDPENHKHLGWAAVELTKAVRQLARNDANKRILVDEGCLPLLVKLVNIGNQDETKVAIECLWVLSFNQENKVKMVAETGLVSCLEGKFNASSGLLKNACHGTLWSLRDQINSPDSNVTVGEAVRSSVLKPRPVSASKSNTPLFKGHIMLSYQWGNQELIKRIVQELRARQIPVWLDIDYMGGSTLQAMAQAVEDSAAVIIAISQKYKDSPNTRAEAEYAFQLRKKIIPLIMQRDYHPDGWLGFILGSKLYYDFSGKHSFDSRMEGLLKAVLEIKDGVDGLVEVPMVSTVKDQTFAATTVLPPVGRAPGRAAPSGDSSSYLDPETIKKWKSQDKEKWLAKHDLKGSTKLSELSGEELVFLHNVKLEAPEFFYRCIESKLGFSSISDLAKVSSALTDLSF